MVCNRAFLYVMILFLIVQLSSADEKVQFKSAGNPRPMTPKCEVTTPCHPCNASNVTISECQATGYIEEYVCTERENEEDSEKSSTQYIAACRKPVEEDEDGIPLLNCSTIFYGCAIIGSFLITLHRRKYSNYSRIRSNSM